MTIFGRPLRMMRIMTPFDARCLLQFSTAGAAKADTIAKLESKNEQLNDELTKSQAHVRRLEKQVANAQNQGIETEKKLTATQRELKATAAAEKAAWEATQKTRSSIIDGLFRTCYCFCSPFFALTSAADEVRSEICLPTC